MTVDLIDMLIDRVEIEQGRSVKHVQVKSKNLIPMAGIKVQERGSHATTEWSPKEDQYLRDNLGIVSEAEMARVLGRTVIAVHLRWCRELMLCAPSKDPNWISTLQAGRLLGIEFRAVANWCEKGLLPYRILPTARKIRLINRKTLDRWVISTSNWIYFDWKKIPDPRLHRLCELRAQRWGDEWLSTAQAAKEFGGTSKDYLLQITKGKIPGVQVAIAKAGRSDNPAWLSWYILRSVAQKVVFIRRGVNQRFAFTPRGAAWALKARLELGWSYNDINRSMGSKVTLEAFRQTLLRLIEEKGGQ